MYVSERVRSQLHELASRRCEYCLLDERCAGRPHEPDHVYADKHGGQTVIANLCLSCFDCNRHKGSDLCSVDVESGEIVPLFHPRQHKWEQHFRLDGAIIEGLTPTGRVTVNLLRMNDPERVEERKMLLRVGKYPDYHDGSD